MFGIDLNLTHNGSTDKQLQLTDILGTAKLDSYRPGGMYISPGQTLVLTYTSQVQNSFHKGVIRGFINLGYLDYAFTLGAEFLEATGFQSQIDALDARVTALEAASGGAIEIQQAGVTVVASASTLNFDSGATVTDAGGGQADVDVVGGGGSDETFAASCPAAVAVLDAVYLTGASAVDEALATVASGAYEVIGFVQSKGSATTCVVQTDGNLTGFVGLTPGATYYLDETTPGAITDTPPSLAGEVFKKVGTASDATTLIINLDEDQILL